MQPIAETIRQSEKIRLDLIRTEIEIAVTFARIALQAKDDPEKRMRNRQNARTAYDAILGLAAQAVFDDAGIEDFRNKVSGLKLLLSELGETGL